VSLILLTGDRHHGKTTACRRLADAARERGYTIGGVVAPAVFQDDQCAGYDVIDLARRRTAPLARIDAVGAERAGCFQFLAEGLALGKAALDFAVSSRPRLVVVDEVGPLELSGGGWSAALTPLASRPEMTLFTVRRRLTPEIARRWTTPPEMILDLADGPDAVHQRALILLDMD